MLLVDILSCSTRYLKSERSERVRYRVEHEKIKFISTREHACNILYVYSGTPYFKCYGDIFTYNVADFKGAQYKARKTGTSPGKLRDTKRAQNLCSRAFLIGKPIALLKGISQLWDHRNL